MHRYAVYVAPPPGALADATARWLGWDPASGQIFPPRADLPFDQAQVTAAPRKYGFHGTIKAPFRLAEGADYETLRATTDQLALRLSPVVIPRLVLNRIKGFLALVPGAPFPPLDHLAARVVSDLDLFRAPLTEAEFARRRPDLLSPTQLNYLKLFGYPYVMDEFRFHMTLSDDLDPAKSAQVEHHLTELVLPHVETPFVLDDLCLFGEDEKGRFHILHRARLSGSEQMPISSGGAPNLAIG
jgi:putative phosphonate metabolism protein